MKLVIDTNRIIASLIKKSLSRRIIVTPAFQFITPDHTLQELSKYENLIRKKAKLTHEEFALLFTLIFEHITIVPKEEYKEFLDTAKTLIKDINDVPFVALVLQQKLMAYGVMTHIFKHKNNSRFIAPRILPSYSNLVKNTARNIS